MGVAVGSTLQVVAENLCEELDLRAGQSLLDIAAGNGLSIAELVYRNADWLAYRWADGLLDADQAQSEQWPALFEQILQEHRRELLPQVVALLQQTSKLAERGLSTEDLDCLWQGANRLIDTHARLVVPTAAQVLSGISAAQVEHLRAELDERNAEYHEDYLDPDPGEREAARVERFTERVERWTGELSTEQARLVEAAVQRMPDVAGEWLRYRERQQQHLLAMLREDRGMQALEDQVAVAVVVVLRGGLVRVPRRPHRRRSY